MSDVKVGDHVRIVIEGPVTNTYVSKNEGQVIAVGGYEYYPEFEGAHITSVEVVEPPKPEWWPPQEGDVLGWGHIAWIRRLGVDEWMAAPGGSVDDARVLELVAQGDARLLVRRGTAVAG